MSRVATGRRLETLFAKMMETQEGKEAVSKYSRVVIDQLHEIRRDCAATEFKHLTDLFKAEEQKAREASGKHVRL